MRNYFSSMLLSPDAFSGYLGQGGGAQSWEEQLKSFSNGFYPPHLPWGHGLNPLKITAVANHLSIFHIDTKPRIFPLLITKNLQYISQPTACGPTTAEKLILLDLAILSLRPSKPAPQPLLSTCHSVSHLGFLPFFLNGSHLPRFFPLNLTDTFCLCWVTPCLCDW